MTPISPLDMFEEACPSFPRVLQLNQSQVQLGDRLGVVSGDWSQALSAGCLEALLVEFDWTPPAGLLGCVPAAAFPPTDLLVIVC